MAVPTTSHSHPPPPSAAPAATTSPALTVSGHVISPEPITDPAHQHPVLLSSSLWHQLTASDPTPAPQRIAVSLTAPTRPLRGAHHRKQQQQAALPAWTSWAQEDILGSASEAPLAKLPGDVASRIGLARSNSRDQDTAAGVEGRQVTVRRCSPVTLSVAYLAATSESGFELAQASQDAIVDQLHDRILHQGDLVRLGLGSSLLSLRVVMTEPVLQGRFDADRTEILMTLDDETERDGMANGDVTMSSTSDLAALTGSSELLDDDADGDEDDALSIDESFLAQSVLQDFSQGSEAFLSSPLGLVSPGSQPQLQHALRPSPSKQEVLARKRKRCQVRELSDQSVLLGAVARWKERQEAEGGGDDNIDEEDVIVLSDKDMAAIGAFDGDWAVAELAGDDKARLVRLFCSSDLASARRTSTTTERLPAAWMSPMLRQNLCDSSFSPSEASNTGSTLTLRPLGARQPRSGDEPRPPVATTCPIPLPFADNVTIARVASPFSVDRAYQGLFLEALRTYFEDRQRICKEGDVIAVAIEAGKARFVRKEGDAAAPSDAAMEDVHVLSLPGGQAGPQKTAVVHFRISSLSSELIAPSKSSAAHGGLVKHEDEASIALKSQAGRLGCVVDPNVTKMVQTGVEKCRVADSARWLRVVSDTPERPRDAEQLDAAAASPLTAPGSAYASLLELLNATLQPHAARFGLHLSVLLKGARGSGKRTVARWVAQATGVQLIEIDCFDLVSDTDARTEGTLRARFDKAADCAPAILLLRNIDALARKSQALETGQEPAMATVLQKCVEELRVATASAADGTTMPVAVFGTTSDPEKCPTGVLGCFKHEIAFQAPNEAERLQMLRISLDRVALSPDVDLKNLATQTAALVAADLVNLVSRAKLASVARIRKELEGEAAAISDADLVLAGVVLTGGDFEQALNKARSSYSESIGAPKIPNVTWDDVGGLASVKSDILDTIQLPLEHPELFSDGLKKRSGILLYGPPGTGKTLLAKAVATSCSLNFFSVKGPELLNMYIGESEANVRRVFQRARDAKPCVIFFDELDSVAPKRGNQGDSGGVMDRIVSQLLAELDGMAGSSEGTDVFVIGATNRPDLLDPALLRPGRFDRMLYLSVSETHAAQLNILEALTRKFKLDDDVTDLSVVANQCPFNLTGADFYALCSDAMLKAMTRKASEIDDTIARLNAAHNDAADSPSAAVTAAAHPHPHPLTPQYYLAEMARPEEVEVKVNRADFEAALRELVPSVSEQEMAHYREVQKKFSTPEDEDKKKKLSSSSSSVAAGGGGGVEIVFPVEEKAREMGKGKGRENEVATAIAGGSGSGDSVPGPVPLASSGGGGTSLSPSPSPSRLPVRRAEIPSSPRTLTSASASAGGVGGYSIAPPAANGFRSSEGEREGEEEAELSGRLSRLSTRQDDVATSTTGTDKSKSKGKGKGQGKDKATDEPALDLDTTITSAGSGKATEKGKGKGKARDA